MVGDAEKRPRHQLRQEDGGDLESWWYPRDGEPVCRRIPRDVLEQARKQQSNSEPYIRFRLVALRSQEFLFELPDHPDAGTVWVDLGQRTTGAREGK